MAFSLSTVPLTCGIEPLALIHEPYLHNRFLFFVDFLSPFEVWVQGAVCSAAAVTATHSHRPPLTPRQTLLPKKTPAEQQLSVSELKHYCRCKDKNRGRTWTEWNSLLTWRVPQFVYSSLLCFTLLWMSNEEFITCTVSPFDLKLPYSLRHPLSYCGWPARLLWPWTNHSSAKVLKYLR